MSLDYLNTQSKLKALGIFIFCGSATIGAMKAGYHVNKVLEISDDMPKLNTYHFTKNFNSVPIVIPSKWENNTYLNNLNKENYDLIFCNTICSGLSQINRNASVDNENNKHFYRAFNAIKQIEPKSFIIENAPTLIAKGFPIIQDMVKQLSDNYYITIIRDYAGNHNVAMKRMRTLVVGWNKKYFSGIPLLEMNKQPQTTVEDILKDFYGKQLGSSPNFEYVSDRSAQTLEKLFKYVKAEQSINEAIVENWNTLSPLIDEKSKKSIQKQKDKIDNGKRYWDKSPYKVDLNKVFPSMTSLTEIIHPIENRPLTIREYARIMCYPDDFIFYPEESKTPIIQCIAQGVPANFIQYITSEIKEALNGNRPIIENSQDKVLNFQHHTKEKYQYFTFDEIMNMKELDIDNKSGYKLLK